MWLLIRSKDMTRISLVILRYNEEDAIPIFLACVVPIMEAPGHNLEMRSTTAGLHRGAVGAYAEGWHFPGVIPAPAGK